MIALRWIGSTLLLLAATTVPSRTDWSQTDLSYVGNPVEYAQTRAICAKAIRAEPPAIDLPTASERPALKGCNSEKLYYGIGMPANPVKARKCAMVERLGNVADPFPLLNGEGMLAIIYANGRGAARNFDVAIHMACQLQDAPAAMDSRIRHLDRLRRGGRDEKPFETCDDITSGVTGGICAEHKAALARQSRDRRIARLKRRWTAAQRKLFDSAFAAFTRYAGIAHEMDCFQGTAAAQCMIDGRESDIEAFLGRIETLTAGDTPRPHKPSQDAVNPAVSGASFGQRIADDPDHRDFYDRNRRDAVAARTAFERNLIVFAAGAFPKLSAHQVRVLFSDL